MFLVLSELFKTARLQTGSVGSRLQILITAASKLPLLSILAHCTRQAPTHPPSSPTPEPPLATEHIDRVSDWFATNRFVLFSCWKQVFLLRLHPLNWGWGGRGGGGAFNLACRASTILSLKAKESFFSLIGSKKVQTPPSSSRLI